MKAIRACISIIVVLATVSVLSACGGGGGGNTNLPPTTYSIMGIVSGAPQGVTVTLSGSSAAMTTTNSIGYYQFTGLANGSYTVTTSMPGYTFSPANRSITINSASAINQYFTVINTYGIAGNAGVSGVTITLVNSSGTSTTTTSTDANGNYSALGLAAGIYTISAVKSGFSMNPLNQKATVTCDVKTGVNFAATAATNTYSIEGTASVGRVALTLSGDNSGIVYTSESGLYAFTGLLPGSYTITVSGGSITTQTCASPISITNTNLTCDLGLSMRSSVNMPPPACLSLSGTITGPASSGVTLDIYRSYYPSSRATTTTDGSGNYLVSIPSSTYVITPSKNGYTFSPPRICGADFSCISGTNVTVTGNFTSQ